ncbi:MAG: filamentous hemagglutinin N-terminal domain-containing protein, partial [Gammaproteobacteria bacterium]
MKFITLKKQLQRGGNFSWIGWKRIFSFSLIASAFSAYANPVVDHVAAGDVSVEQNSNSTVINQTSQKAIINWQSFNIAQPESTHFQQPAGGITLNRISPSQGPSSIYGRLTATGQIILMNPAGIFFGPTAYVNVGGMIATTGNMTDHDFMNGNYHFSFVSPYSGASIINEGQLIAADHGLIALVGPNVINHGLIQANLGQVVLASGNAFTIDFTGDQLVNFSIDEKASGSQTGITHTGTIMANGGKVLVTAQSAQAVLDNVINIEGVVQARSVGVRNGEIILSGDTNRGVVRVAAKIDASGKGAGQRGGRVQITGHNILIDSQATVDVSGETGGGDLYIGGNAHGIGPLPHANAVVMAPNAQLIADAITTGNGGNIVLWSDNVTKAYGLISARGGILSGDGGWVETSSYHYLDVNGVFVDTRAPNGLMGTWLLDPSNIYIALNQANATAAGMTGTDTSANTGSGSNPVTFQASGAIQDSLLTTSSLTTSLATSNVSVTTTNASGTGIGNITVVDPITWSSTNSLTLTAANNIIINAAITATNGSLNLSAVNAANSITTGASGTINVKNFNLTQGRWTQISASLPSFTVSSNFQINSGTMPSTVATFIRAIAGDGSSGSPYQLVDVYGLQGVGSTSTTLGNSFKLANNIDASTTSNWNSGKGFVPIGSGTNYSGTFNGQNFTITNLFISLPSAGRDAGMFGGTTGATISNLGLITPSVTGSSTNSFSTGILIGAGSATLSNVFIYNGTITAGGGSLGGMVGNFVGNISQSFITGAVTSTGTGVNVGGFAGVISGAFTLQNSYANVAVSSPSATRTGGLVGNNSGSTITTSYSMGNVSGGAISGGLVGINSGTVSNSFWDTATSGKSAGVSSNTGTVTNVTGGCFTGSSCANGGTANLSSQTTYSSAPYNWNFSTVWSILGSQSYPYLQNVYYSSASSPRAIVGSTSAAANTTIKLAANGSVLDNVRTGANGSFYFLEPNNTVADNSNLLIYITGGSTFGNAIVIAPSSGGSVSGTTGLTITNNTVALGNSATSTLSNSILNTAKGSISDSNILYSVSGGNLTLTGSNSLTTTATTTYDLDGNISSSGGSLTFNGPINMTNDSTLSTTSSGVITLAAALTGNSHNLTVSSPSAGSTISGAMSGLNNFTSSGAGTLTLSNTNSYSGATSVTAGTLSVTLAGGIDPSSTISISPGATLTLGFSNATWGNAINLNGSLVFNGTGNTLTNTLTLGNSTTINTGGTLAISGAIGGTGSLTKTGSSSLTLSGTNTYSGATTISAGTLNLNTASSLGNTASTTIATSSVLNIGFSNGTLANSNPITLNGTGSGSGVLTFTGSNVILNNNITLGSNVTIGGTGTATLNGIISGAFNFTKASTNLLTLGGANTYSGTTSVNAGTLSIAGTGGLGNTSSTNVALDAVLDFSFSNGTAGNTNTITLNGGTNSALTFSGTNATANNNITLAAITRIGGTGSGTLGGAISGAFNLTKADSGSITLSGSNTYSGSTFITGGTLSLGAAGAVNNTSFFTISPGAILDIGFSNATLTNTNAITMQGTLAFSGTNAVVNNPISLSGSGSIGGSGSGTLGGVISSGALIKTGTGTITLSASNTYSGGTTINGGILSLTNINALSNNTVANTTVASGGTLDIAFSNATLFKLGSPSIILNGTGASNNGALTFSGTNAVVSYLINLGSDAAIGGTGSGTLSSAISGSFSLTKTGSGTISLGNTIETYTGSTFINAGTLKILSNNNTIPSTSDITIASGATFDLNNHSQNVSSIAGAGNITLGNATLTTSGNPSTTFSGVISGTGNVVKGGTGTLILSGSNTYSGTTTVNGGTLSLSSASAINNTSSMSVASGSTLDLAFSSGTLGTTNTITLNGDGVGNNGALTYTGTNNILSNNITLGSNTTLGGVGSVALNGIISGGFSLTTLGSGTITLAGANTYSGGTTLTAGTLVLGAGNSAGTGTLTFNGGTLAANSTITVNNALALNASSSIGGTNSLTLGGNGTLSSGTLTVSNTATTTLSGILSGTGNISQSAGTLILSRTNTYSGSTTLTGGTLQANNATNPLGTGTFNLNGGTFQAINQATTLGNSSFTVANSPTISGSQNITFSNSGSLGGGSTLTITNSGITTFNGISGSGGITLNNATLQIASDPVNPLGTGILTFNGGTLLASVPVITNPLVNTFIIGSNNTGTISGSNSITLSGSGLFGDSNSVLNITNTAGTITFSNVLSGSGSITQNGSGGTLALSVANTYTGNTTVTAGTLTLGNNAAIGTGTLIFNGGTVTSNSSIAINNAFTVAANSILGGSNNLTLSGNGALNSGATLTVSNS